MRVVNTGTETQTSGGISILRNIQKLSEQGLERRDLIPYELNYYLIGSLEALKKGTHQLWSVIT